MIMNCFDETQNVINYIENNILQLDLSGISKLTGIPLGLYQRIFSYICGISISEYVRRRRLTEAANKLLHSNDSVINIAMEYGYDSHAAFTRAFKEHFGVPPINLTDEIYKVKSFRRLSFQEENETYQIVKGRRIMAELVKIEYVEMEERLLIGISKRNYGVDAPGLWKIYFEGEFSERLSELSKYQSEDMTEDYIGLGYASDFKDDVNLGDEYIIGRYFKPGTPVPDKMVSKVIPKGFLAKAQVKGKSLDDIIYNAYILIREMAQKNGYHIDNENFYWTEIYTLERYCTPFDHGSEELILDWLIPCIK
jgi:AraC family transcriptional regulator